MNNLDQLCAQLAQINDQAAREMAETGHISEQTKRLMVDNINECFAFVHAQVAIYRAQVKAGSANAHSDPL